MRAMILAAGYGTRLWPLTIDRTKPAIPFMGRPLIGYVAEYLARYGFDEIVVNLHHRPESVRAALGDGQSFGVRFHYVEEPVILGTSGAIDNARHLLEGDAFVVINGKIATDIDLRDALATHRRTHALATLVLRPNPARERYSTVEVSDGLITGFGGHPTSDNASSAHGAAQNESQHDESRHESPQDESPHESLRDESPLMFTGIQILDPRIFDFIPRGIFSHSVTDVYVPAIARGERIAAHVARGIWYELSTVRRYLDTSIALMKREGRNVELGRGSVLETGADIAESVLWENVLVARGARVRRAVLGAGVEVGSRDVFENVAVVRAELARGVEPPEKGLRGEFHGSNFVAPIPE
ncbi:MAG: mannose-phosphate guanylyltransferase [Acidobacteriota bacterium]|jgi:NDP-sugar pyrophosphorylase family protein|nr:mannose-phosphate guanylyltransferase [Acidobacteriota bacterium]